MEIITAVITPWYERPMPLPLDFIGTTKFVERLQVFRKEQGCNIPSLPGPPFGSSGYTTPAYFIFVMTRFGDMRLDISEKVFNLLKIDDWIVVEYRYGRWTGALKGAIAR